MILNLEIGEKLETLKSPLHFVGGVFSIRNASFDNNFERLVSKRASKASF
jgi:hypothetical protein